MTSWPFGNVGHGRSSGLVVGRDTGRTNVAQTTPAMQQRVCLSGWPGPSQSPPHLTVQRRLSQRCARQKRATPVRRRRCQRCPKYPPLAWHAEPAVVPCDSFVRPSATGPPATSASHNSQRSHHRQQQRQQKAQVKAQAPTSAYNSSRLPPERSVCGRDTRRTTFGHSLRAQSEPDNTCVCDIGRGCWPPASPPSPTHHPVPPACGSSFVPPSAGWSSRHQTTFAASPDSGSVRKCIRKCDSTHRVPSQLPIIASFCNARASGGRSSSTVPHQVSYRGPRR